LYILGWGYSLYKLKKSLIIAWGRNKKDAVNVDVMAGGILLLGDKRLSLHKKRIADA
jgi:hypothetical protein